MTAGQVLDEHLVVTVGGEAGSTAAIVGHGRRAGVLPAA
jgi:hypothetical protein